MNQGDFAVSPGCAVNAGTIFIRRCRKPVVAECAECSLPLCEQHAQPWNANAASPDAGGIGAAFASLGDVATVYCPTCLSRLAGTEPATTDDDNFSGGNGIGGDLTVWDNSTFTEADYAAFDAVSDFDKDTGRGFDS